MSAGKGFDWEAAKARLERARLAIESEGHNSEQVEALHRGRAEALARRDAGSAETGERILIFRLGQERYAFPLAKVAEVVMKPRIAPAPAAPPEVAGLIQVRGEIRPVWDPAPLLGLTQTDSSESRDVLLLRLAGGEAGCLVSEVEDILAVKEDERRPAPDKAPHAAWMTSDRVVVLDPATLFPGRTERNGQE